MHYYKLIIDTEANIWTRDEWFQQLSKAVLGDRSIKIKHKDRLSSFTATDEHLKDLLKFKVRKDLHCRESKKGFRFIEDGFNSYGLYIKRGYAWFNSDDLRITVTLKGGKEECDAIIDRINSVEHDYPFRITISINSRYRINNIEFRNIKENTNEN
jgi:hypothetical protein